ncbi:MAG: hypothetical protein IAE80_29000 [Anaerolinea sp.]|nr:hypothetical protein [Anaerolinea sp.]
MTSTVTGSAARPRERARVIALVWAPHEGRTQMFAQRLNAPLYNVHFLLYKRPYIAPFKYVLQAIKTWSILLRERPRVVYVTNPPVFAPLCVWLYSLFSGTKLIIDTHPPSLYSRRWGWTLPLQRFLIQRAYVNVTDQRRFADLFASWGARAVVLPNPPKNPPVEEPSPLTPLPQGEGNERRTTNSRAFSPTSSLIPPFALREKGTGDKGAFEVAVINTFAVDEPLDIILDAAAKLPEAHFSIMGERKLAPQGVIERAPANVTFTDYLRGAAYWNCLRDANAVMVLTTYPYSLLGGAQDAVAVDTPLVLSDQPALREYFTAGTIFIPNTADGIVEGVRAAQRDESRLRAEITQLGSTQEAAWQTQFDDLLARIEAAQSR